MVYIEKMEKFLASHAFPSLAVVNYDETRICIGSDGKMRIKRLVFKTKNKPQLRGGVKFTHTATFLPFVNIPGEIVASDFIFLKVQRRRDCRSVSHCPSCEKGEKQENLTKKRAESDL